MKALVPRKEGLSEWGEEDAPVVDARLLAVLDLSGSMGRKDAGEEGTRRRVDVLKDALDKLMESFPNQLAVVGFNTDVFSVSLGVTELRPVGCTNLYGALVASSQQAAAIQNVVLVSDGQPTDGKEREAIDLVCQWNGLGVKFSVIYCGPRGGLGEQFLRRLAQAGGGAYNRVDVKVHLLVDALQTALLAAPSGQVIQL